MDEFLKYLDDTIRRLQTARINPEVNLNKDGRIIVKAVFRDFINELELIKLEYLKYNEDRILEEEMVNV